MVLAVVASAAAGAKRRQLRSAAGLDGPGSAQQYWLLDTGAAWPRCHALIVCLVGAVITNQSFAVVVAASAREYATLNARRPCARWPASIEQACLVGGLGMVLAVAGLRCCWWPCSITCRWP